MTAERSAYGLGLAGLLPFWVLAIGHIAGLRIAGADEHLVGLALATYAATILSFLGGIRWGFAVAQTRPLSAYAASVVPQLCGWFALALPDPFRFIVLGLAILVLGPLDRGLVRQGVAPTWFGSLRMILSLGAGAALFLAALA